METQTEKKKFHFDTNVEGKILAHSGKQMQILQVMVPNLIARKAVLQSELASKTPKRQRSVRNEIASIDAEFEEILWGMRPMNNVELERPFTHQ